MVTRNSYRYFRTAMAINSDGDKKVDSDFSAITLHTWHSFEIKQWHEASDNKVGPSRETQSGDLELNHNFSTSSSRSTMANVWTI